MREIQKERAKNIQIRFATVDDANDIRAIYSAAIINIPNSIYTAAQKAAWAARRPAMDYQKLIKAGDELFLLGLVESKPAAFGSSLPGELKMLYVHPNYQGSGLGYSLYESLEKLAQNKGMQELMVKASVNAAPFYQKLGYQTDRHETIKLCDGVAIPHVIMSKLIG